MDPGAGVSQRSATRDGDGVEDDESEEVTQEDEPNSLKADHSGRPADNGVGREAPSQGIAVCKPRDTKEVTVQYGKIEPIIGNQPSRRLV